MPSSDHKDPPNGQPPAHKPGSFDSAMFMRARHPELFSDSVRETKPLLSSALLEYQLDTLTNRKEELKFEYFCRRLAEKEICPNLRPQTGPTGGGDSKVDTETIPVASEISVRWAGVNPAAGNERWAFAFSAKKDWRAKARADIRGIAGTGRKYKRIYFITSQFAPDKPRAKLEDQLSQESGIAVFILDRSWIVKSVIENDRVQIAVEALGLSGLTQQDETRIGPRDLERKQELEELEKEIGDPSRYQGARYQLAEDCLRAALLARGMERPRADVDGHFSRAERIAAQVGHHQQQLRIAYQRAWTAFWWYGDVGELTRLYDVVEGLATNSMQADDMELLQNLWQLLVSAERKGDLDPEVAKLGDRTARLTKQLDRLANDSNRPNNALQAKTNRLLIDLNEAFKTQNAEEIDKVWGTFQEIIREAGRLGDYPFEHFARLIEELGDLMPDSEAFDRMFEDVLHLLELRRGEGESGIVLNKRAFQKLDAGKPYDAIRLFGRAQDRLIKREYRGELVLALAGSSFAYERVGLLWAARNGALAAAERCLAFYHEDGSIVRPVLPCLEKLAWLELQLGRLPRLLEVVELRTVLSRHLKLEPNRIDRLENEQSIQDAILGLLLLRSSLDLLADMELLPDVLESLGLLHSKMGLLYALGYEPELREEGFIPASESTESVRQFFFEWSQQPAATQIPTQPVLMVGDVIRFQSNVLGCDLIVSVANNDESIYLAEALLGGIEAFLATSLDARVAPFREEARINIQPSAAVSGAPEIAVREVDGEPIVEIVHANDPSNQTGETRAAYRNALQDAIVTILCHIAIIDAPEAYFDRIAGDERAFGRALSFADIKIIIANIFGRTPKLRLSDWTDSSVNRRYALNRVETWNSEGKTEPARPQRGSAPKPGSGPPPADMLAELDTLKHGQRRVQSLIDIPLWDKAKWSATLYLEDPRYDPPLLLGLGFKDIQAGRSIFTGWRKRLGLSDAEDELRVAIVTGVDRQNPFFYNVIIGTNPQFNDDDPDSRYFLMVSRINRMTPERPENLNRFVESFRTIRRYVIAPVHFTDVSAMPRILGDVCIEKSTLIVRPAWQIGENDPDICCIDTDCDPIIPGDVVDAPILGAIKRLKSMRKGHASD